MSLDSLQLGERSTGTRPEALEFRDCAMVTLSLGKSAHNLRELRERVAEIPPQSLLHHFFETLLRPTFDYPEFSNDLALWALHSLHDSVLGERLGIVDAGGFADVETLRSHLLDILDERLSEVAHLTSTAPGHEFRFLRSQLLVFATDRRAEHPAELARIVPRLSTGSIFYHFLDARRRNPGRVDDLALWLEGWGEPWRSACGELALIGIHHGALSELRERIAAALSRVEPERRA